MGGKETIIFNKYLVTTIWGNNNLLNNWIPKYTSFRLWGIYSHEFITLPAKQVRHTNKGRGGRGSGGARHMCTRTGVGPLNKIGYLVPNVFLRFPFSVPKNPSCVVLPGAQGSSGSPLSLSQKISVIVTVGLVLERYPVSSINWVSGSLSTTYCHRILVCRRHCERLWRVVGPSALFLLCATGWGRSLLTVTDNKYMLRAAFFMSCIFLTS